MPLHNGGIAFGGGSGGGGGIPPHDLTTFTSQSTEEGILLSFSGPEPTYLPDADGQPVFAAAPRGIMIRYSTDGYPLKETDGVLAYNYNPEGEDWNGTETNTYTVVGLTKDTKYYFTAFPYSDYGVFNRSESSKNRTEMTWVGNKGTISVNVQTPAGYIGTLGEYTITLVDQATESPQNIEQTFSGVGVKQIGNLDGGKTYKVRLGTPGDDELTAPADSEAITIVAGTNQEVTMAYAYKHGTVTVNVTATPSNMPSKFTQAIDVTLVPQNGGEEITKSASGSGSVSFDNAIAGTQYKAKVGNSYFPETTSTETVTCNSEQAVSLSVSCSASSDLQDYTWEDIRTLALAEIARTLFPLGARKSTNCKYIQGDFKNNTSGITTKDMTTDCILVSNYVNTSSGDSNKRKSLMFLTAKSCGKGRLASYNSTFDKIGLRVADSKGRIGFSKYLAENQDTLFPEISPYAIGISETWLEACDVNGWTSLNEGYTNTSNGYDNSLKFMVPSSAMLGSLAEYSDFYWNTEHDTFDNQDEEWKQYQMYAGNGGNYDFDMPYMIDNERRKLDINGRYATRDIVITQNQEIKWLCVPSNGGATAEKVDVDSYQEFPLFFIIGQR